MKVTQARLQEVLAELGTMPFPKNYIAVKEYVTRKYTMFTLHPNQRDIDLSHVNDLVEEIESGHNRLPFNPSTVDSLGRVVSGQHRFIAAYITQNDFHFKIDPNATPETSRREGVGSKDWTIQDSLKSNASLGLPAYVALQEFWRAHSWMTLSTAADLCTKGNRGGVNFRKYFGSGRYIADNIEEACQVAKLVLDFKPFVPHYNDRRFVTTVRALSKMPHYDHKRMLRKVAKQGYKLQKFNNGEMYYPVFDEIYNFYEPEDNRFPIRRPIRKIKRGKQGQIESTKVEGFE